MSTPTLAKIIRDLVDQRVDERLGELLGHTSAPTLRMELNKPTRPAPKRWTDEECTQIVRDCLAGMNLSQMAHKYRRSSGAVRLRLYGKSGLMHKETVVRRAMGSMT